MRLSEKQASDLIEILKALPDPRCKRGCDTGISPLLRFPFAPLYAGVVVMPPSRSGLKIVLKKMLERLWCRKKDHRYIPPSEPTIRRQLQKIDAEKVDMAVSEWLGRLASGNAIGIDGKTLRGARRDDGTKVHLLSAFIHQQGITIAQKEVPAKSNEIPSAIPCWSHWT